MDRLIRILDRDGLRKAITEVLVDARMHPRSKSDVLGILGRSVRSDAALTAKIQYKPTSGVVHRRSCAMKDGLISPAGSVKLAPKADLF